MYYVLRRETHKKERKKNTYLASFLTEVDNGTLTELILGG